jgi:hypothetical protein
MRAQWVIAFSALALLAGCASMNQTENQVFKRVSGDKLRFWLPTHDASLLHWPYAWAAVAAYQDADDRKRKPLPVTPDCPEPHQFLKQEGWTLWTELPLLGVRAGEPQPASDQMRDVHLRVEVWSSETERKVIVAFGGTAVTSLEDLKSNMRWFLKLFNSHDAYDVLTDVFVPEFVKDYQKKSNQPGWEWLRSAQVVATGHSLGGGLAQRFSYSLQPNQGVPVVTEVYAFDPSPVSGKRSTSDWWNQAHGLTIYRIYNRGEILASARSILQLTNPGNKRADGQDWIDIRYRDGWTWRTLLPSGSVHAHGMFSLACFMKKYRQQASAQVSAPPQQLPLAR